MHAIVRTIEAPGTLARLAPAGTVGALPLCGKSLLAHALDDLAMAEVNTVDVVAGNATDAIADQLGSGRRWGMELRYRASMDEVDVPADRGPVLVVDVDRARGPVALELRQHASSMPSRGWRAYSEGEFTGVAMLPAGMTVRAADVTAASAVEVDAGVVIRLHHTADLLAAQSAALSTRLRGLLFEARPNRAGHWLGAQARVAATSLDGEHVFVGERSWVEPSARLGENVVLGADVVVDRGARLRNCLVLDGTYIGENLDLENAIVAGALLARADTGIVTEVGDPFLLASMKGRKPHAWRRAMTRWLEGWRVGLVKHSAAEAACSTPTRIC